MSSGFVPNPFILGRGLLSSYTPVELLGLTFLLGVNQGNLGMLVVVESYVRRTVAEDVTIVRVIKPLRCVGSWLIPCIRHGWRLCPHICIGASTVTGIRIQSRSL